MNQFSLASLQVFLDSPELSSVPGASVRIPELIFPNDHAWDFQVVVDGFHEQARIYDAEGVLIGRGLDIFVKQVMKASSEEPDSADAMSDGVRNTRVEKTRITASLPIALVGDPAKGEWNYYVVIGLADPRSRTGMYPRPYDCIRYREVGAIELQPLRGNEGL
jgi:hypothetical protein